MKFFLPKKIYAVLFVGFIAAVPKKVYAVLFAGFIASALAQAAAASPPKTAAEAETATDSANTLPPLVLSPSAANAASALALPSPALPPAEAEAEAPADSPAASSPPIADEHCEYHKAYTEGGPKASCPFTRAQKAVIHEMTQLVVKNERKCREAIERSLRGQEKWQYKFEEPKYACMLKDTPELAKRVADLSHSVQVRSYIADPFINALMSYEIGAYQGRCSQEWRRFEASIGEKDLIDAFGKWAEKKAPKFIAHKYDISEADQLGLRAIMRGTKGAYKQFPPKICSFAEEVVWSSEPDISPTAIGAFASYREVISRGEDPEMPGDDSADERGAQP